MNTRTTRTWWLTTALIGAALCLASTAQAKKARKHEWGVGVMGLLNGSFISEPSDEDKVVNGRLTPYPGFAGIGGGGGLSVSYMFRGAIGFELDVLYMYEEATGSVNVQGLGEFDVTADQTAVHVPLLLKAAIPWRSARPFLLVGPEFIIPGDGNLSTGRLTGIGNQSFNGTQADFYTALGFGLGVDFILPVSGADLRIPLTLRGNWNPGFPDNVSEMYPGFGDGGEFDLLTEWELQAFLTLGVAYVFR